MRPRRHDAPANTPSPGPGRWSCSRGSGGEVPLPLAGRRDDRDGRAPPPPASVDWCAAARSHSEADAVDERMPGKVR